MIKKVREYIPTGGVVCDIGTRYGALVRKLGENQYRAIGVEYNAESVRLARSEGLNGVYHGSISDLPRICTTGGISRVNAFIMDDVLEHLANPSRDLHLLSTLQMSGDYLFLRQMDTDSFGHRMFADTWYYLQPAAHMYYFNEKTLTRMLQSKGYRVREVIRESLVRNAKAAVRTLLQSSLGISFTPKTPRPLYLLKRSALADLFLIIAVKE